jgi:transglutaminase/protease-like cytokinesis protein 3
LQSEDSEAESDSQEMEDPTYSETAESVLSRGSARRFGFASLFHEMAKHVGIESILIKGYLKDPSKPRESTKLPEPNHAWIAVKIQGYYRIIDCGLGCSSHPLNPNGTSEPFYFLTNPQKIIFTHFPIEHRHQLIRPPVSFAVFNELPYATSHYFDYGIRFLNLKGGIFTVNDDQTAELDILVPHGAQTSAQLEIPDPNGRVIRKQKPLVQHKMDGNRRISKLLIRIKGKESMGVLKFFCNMSSLESTPSNSPLVLSMTVQHTGIKQPEDFIHIIPSSKEFYIVEPINLNLLYNISYRFHVQPSGDNKHFKLVLRSPNLKTHKFVYYPGDQGYVANVTVRERGQWAISYMKDMGNDGRPTKKDSWINVACYKCI